MKIKIPNFSKNEALLINLKITRNMHAVHQTRCFKGFVLNQENNHCVELHVSWGLTINKKSHVTIVFHHMEWSVAHIQAFFSLSDI